MLTDIVNTPPALYMFLIEGEFTGVDRETPATISIYLNAGYFLRTKLFDKMGVSRMKYINMYYEFCEPCLYQASGTFVDYTLGVYKAFDAIQLAKDD